MRKFITGLSLLFLLAIAAPTLQAQTKTMEQAQKLREANPPKALWEAIKTASYWYWIFHAYQPAPAPEVQYAYEQTTLEGFYAYQPKPKVVRDKPPMTKEQWMKLMKVSDRYGKMLLIPLGRQYGWQTYLQYNRRIYTA